MQLQKLAVEDRSFLIQLNEIEKEFGNHIPWFNKIKGLKYLTDATELKPQILETLQLDSSVQIDPYILTADTRWKEYVWSILNFSSSPERFLDNTNETIRKQLEDNSYAYITCLQIRDGFRQNRLWTELISRSLEQILKRFEKFWWVVEYSKLLPYYERFGLQVINNYENEDNLWLIVGDIDSFVKRH